MERLPRIPNLANITASVSAFAGEIEHDFSLTWQRVQGLEERVAASELRAANAEQVSAKLLERLEEQCALLESHIKQCSIFRASEAEDKFTDHTDPSLIPTRDSTAALKVAADPQQHSIVAVTEGETNKAVISCLSITKTDRGDDIREGYSVAKDPPELPPPASQNMRNLAVPEQFDCGGASPLHFKGWHVSLLNKTEPVSVIDMDTPLAPNESAVVGNSSRMKRKRRRKIVLAENCYEAPRMLAADSESPHLSPYKEARVSTINACDQKMATESGLRETHSKRQKAVKSESDRDIAAVSKEGLEPDRVEQGKYGIQGDQLGTGVHQDKDLTVRNLRENTHRDSKRARVEPCSIAVKDACAAPIKDGAIQSSAACNDSFKTPTTRKSIPELLMRRDLVDRALGDQPEERLPISPWLNTRRRNDQESWSTSPAAPVLAEIKSPPARQRVSRSHSRKFASVADAVRFVSRRHDTNLRKQAGVANSTVRGKDRAALDAAACRECDEFFRQEAAGHPDPVCRRQRSHLVSLTVFVVAKC
jgi:hypothetical protein